MPGLLLLLGLVPSPTPTFLEGAPSRHRPGRTGRMKTLDRSKHIVNLSSHTLSSVETLVLSKGLTFVPSTTRARRSILLNDFGKFARRLRIQHIFRDSPREYRKNPFHVPSSWTPPTTDNPELESYIKNTRSKVMNLPFDQQRSNLTSEKHDALISCIYSYARKTFWDNPCSSLFTSPSI